MYDKELALEILSRIYQATQTILKRFEKIKSPDDFTGSDAGMEKLDAICMQLIAIGEGLKYLDEITNNTLLHRYPQIEWKKVKGMRDILTHHYFDLDAEAIYGVCKNHMDVLVEMGDWCRNCFTFLLGYSGCEEEFLLAPSFPKVFCRKFHFSSLSTKKYSLFTQESLLLSSYFQRQRVEVDTRPGFGYHAVGSARVAELIDARELKSVCGQAVEAGNH